VSRILVVANDVVAARMAGPGIRCFELARQLLNARHQVTLAGGAVADFELSGLTVVPRLTAAQMDAVASQHDAIMVQGFALRDYPALRNVGVPLIVDIYDPFPLALLEQEKALPIHDRDVHGLEVRRILEDLLASGDFFLCASERQRDLWIGALTAVGRVNPRTWSADDSLRHLIDVVPFGLPDAPPEVSGSPPPGFPPAVSAGDVVLIWGGGIYNWFDPLTLLQAVSRVVSRDLPLKLLFMSTNHPNPGVPPQMWMPERAKQLATELGLAGTHVFFNDDWVPYVGRADWLGRADCGVSTHFNNAETRYSFRTRMLDYLWAGLPIITTEGDVLSDLVQQRQLGWTVPPGEVSPLAEALEEMMVSRAERERIAARVRATAAEMTWTRAAQPLLQFCSRLQIAPDEPRAGYIRQGRPSAARLHLQRPRHLLLTGWESVRKRGLTATMRRTRAWWTARRR
jgi:glycosyltransferase involved in cell wall biosynthesis